MYLTLDPLSEKSDDVREVGGSLYQGNEPGLARHGDAHLVPVWCEGQSSIGVGKFVQWNQ